MHKLLLICCVFPSQKFQLSRLAAKLISHLVSLFCFQEIEPVKLVWTENSKCFYSEEFKIPTGKYVGNLVVDGVFYPVEDITVKHYTFEVDLYLKDGRYYCLGKGVWVCVVG